MSEDERVVMIDGEEHWHCEACWQCVTCGNCICDLEEEGEELTDAEV